MPPTATAAAPLMVFLIKFLRWLFIWSIYASEMIEINFHSAVTLKKYLCCICL